MTIYSLDEDFDPDAIYRCPGRILEIGIPRLFHILFRLKWRW